MSGGIDGILAFFEQHSVIGMMNLQPHAEWLLYMLACIDFAVTYMFSPDTMKHYNFLQKVIRYGFFLFIVRNFQDMANMLFQTFATAGAVAASGTASTVALSPGALWNKGFQIVGTLFDQCFKLSIINSFGTWLLSIVTICFIGIATFKMVFQFLEMKIEFCIFSSLAVFFIPFSCVNSLSFLFQRIITGFFSSLTKIMVMYFMLALVQSEITKFTVSVGNSGAVNLDTVNVGLRFLVMGLIVVNLPQFAANIMSGNSSMGGSIGSFASGMAVGAVKAPLTGAALAAGGVQQYKNRLGDGQSKTQAALGTAGALIKDIGNMAAHDPAGKIWFPNYDRGRSQTLRPAYPFENTPKNSSNQDVGKNIAQKQKDDINIAKTKFSGESK